MSEQLTATYNGEEIKLPAGTSEANARAAMEILYPEVKNATVTREGNNFVFEVKSSKKG